ncbi:hypothetical protein C3Z06_11290 [Cupriavidus metallidurans]|jgi:hypothetical protein|nr:hypothetical protein C3Z06_11290 [Cupriavidus metallidurans]
MIHRQFREEGEFGRFQTATGARLDVGSTMQCGQWRSKPTAVRQSETPRQHPAPHTLHILKIFHIGRKIFDFSQSVRLCSIGD